jgi:hypothetical protein
MATEVKFPVVLTQDNSYTNPQSNNYSIVLRADLTSEDYNLYLPRKINSGGYMLSDSKGQTEFTSEFKTNSFEIVDPSDSTKKMDFDLSGISSGAIRTLKMSDGNTELVAPVGSKLFVVDGERTDSYTITGDSDHPFKTVQTALDAVVASGATRAVIKVLPGVYTETLSLTYDDYLRVELFGAHIIGNLTWTITAAVQSYKAKLIFVGGDARGFYPSIGYHLTCIEGNVTIDQSAITTSRYVGLHFFHTGIVGNLSLVGNNGVLTHLFFMNSGYTGDIICDPTPCPTGVLYAYDITPSGSASIGGALGKVTPYNLQNIRVNRPWTIGTPDGGGGGFWMNVYWGAALNFAYNGNLYIGTVRTDLYSYSTFFERITTNGNQSFNIKEASLSFSQVISSDTTITPHIDYFYPVTKGSVASITLSLANARNGIKIVIMAMTAFAHVVTLSSGTFNNGANNTATFGGAIGDNLNLVYYNGDWYIISDKNIVYS